MSRSVARLTTDSGPEQWPFGSGIDWKKVAERWYAIKTKYKLAVGAYEAAVLAKLSR